MRFRRIRGVKRSVVAENAGWNGAFSAITRYSRKSSYVLGFNTYLNKIFLILGLGLVYYLMMPKNCEKWTIKSRACVPLRCRPLLVPTKGNPAQLLYNVLNRPSWVKFQNPCWVSSQSLSSLWLPPGMGLGCRLTSVKGDRGENYEKWTAGLPISYKGKYIYICTCTYIDIFSPIFEFTSLKVTVDELHVL